MGTCDFPDMYGLGLYAYISGKGDTIFTWSEVPMWCNHTNSCKCFRKIILIVHERHVHDRPMK